VLGTIGVGDAVNEATVRLEVNGEQHVLSDVPADRRLVDVLRDDLGLTGTKESCAVGVCGVCTVSLDGEIVSSCLVLARTLDGSAVRTVEGLAGTDGPLTPLQEAFIAHGGFQCGICTPGQLMSATALLAEQPHPDEVAIREWMAGNLCRCTGYQQIVDSILAAAEGSQSVGERAAP
jgi:carbon-monoxide dehydrogenase small subunit